MLMTKNTWVFEMELPFYLAQYAPDVEDEAEREEKVEDCFLCFVPYGQLIKAGFSVPDEAFEDFEADSTVLCEVDGNPLSQQVRDFKVNVCEEFYRYPTTSKGTIYEGYFEIGNPLIKEVVEFVFDF